MRRCPIVLALSATASLPGIAVAHESHGQRLAPGNPAPRIEIEDSRPAWKQDTLPAYAPPAHGMDARARDEWLSECRRRASARDRGLGGAAIGAVAGGVLGNRIAGKGDRTAGTVAGAVIGAAAGAVVDKAEDRGRIRDECEAYLDDYYARYAQPAASPHPGYASA
ncbi:MAG: glycine zipper 2TM domain-containing protein, partial [Novosphingobium sp.]